MSLLRSASCQRNSNAKLPLIDDDPQTKKKQGKLIGPEHWSWKYLIFITASLLVISLILSIFCFLVWSDVNICLWLDRTDSDECVSLFHPNANIVHNSKEHYKLNGHTSLSDQCSNMPKKLRFDCHPEDGASMLSCSARGCCWDVAAERNNRKLAKPALNVPYCYYPENWSLYELKNSTQGDNNYTAFWSNTRASFYKKDIQLIRMQSQVTNGIVHLMISDPNDERYQPHLPIINHPWGSSKIVGTPQYSVETSSDSPGFRISRKSDNTTVFDAIIPKGFIFSNQFLQLSGLLPTNNIYGLGEHRTNLKLNTNWQILTMFNKDQPPTENANLYGSHPFYLGIEESGNCHGVLFLNSNAMDVILQPTPAITFRSIGGIFDIYFFMGPTASDVMRQYAEIIGKPFMPPYWSLGFHLCRFGYGSLDKTIEVWNRTRVAGIPFDTQWNDLDYMDRNDDFTYDKRTFKELPNFVEKLHQLGMKYIPLIDAGLPAHRPQYPPLEIATEHALLITSHSGGDAFEGKVWNADGTVWPDFTNPDTLEYWQEMMNDLWMMFRYDGAWIDMNEPSNFFNGAINGCYENDFDYPPYTPNVVGNLLATKTLCMYTQHYLGLHYDIHNTHGTNEAVLTNKALAQIRGYRPFVISRSTWVGHGAYAGHWSGDIYSSWHDMRMSVPQLLSFSLFQIPMMGADICGFDGNTTESLCNRWMQLGAFYPFSRNHNSDDTIEQDPVAMGELVVKSSRKALMIRYRLLPYLYTLFFRAHKFGDTVARPLFFEFQSDSLTYDVDSQFLWGSSLMIIPVFEEGATQVTAYLPRDIWYDFYDKQSLNSSARYYTLEAPLDTIPLLVRGGSILPAQTPATTTTASRNNDFELIIALDERGFAKGELYWDDGDTIDSVETTNHRWLEFSLDNQIVNVREVDPGEYNGKMILGKVEVMGVINAVNKVSINETEVEFQYDKLRRYLIVKNLQVDLKMPFTLSWT